MPTSFSSCKAAPEIGWEKNKKGKKRVRTLFILQSCPPSEILSASLRARVLPPGSATLPSAGGAEAPLARAALWVLCPCVITGAHAVPRRVANGHVSWGCRCWLCLCCWLPSPRQSPAPPVAASRAGMCSCRGAATRGHLGAPQMAATGCLPAPSRRRDNCPSAPFIPLMFRACSTSDPSCLPSLMTQIWEIRAALVVSIHSQEPVFACASQASEIITRCSAFLGLQSVFLLFPSINMDAQLLLKRINKNKKGQAPNPVCFPSVMQSQCCLCPKFTQVGLGEGGLFGAFFPQISGSGGCKTKTMRTNVLGRIRYAMENDAELPLLPPHPKMRCQTRSRAEPARLGPCTPSLSRTCFGRMRSDPQG